MKKIIIINLLFIVISNLNSDTIYLKDGKIIKGELYSLNRYNLSLYSNNKIYIFNYYDVDYYMSDIVNEKKININFLNINKKVYLVKLTQDLLFYKEYQDNNYNTVLLNKLSNLYYNSNIKLNKTAFIYYSRIKKDKDINNDIDNLIENIFSSKKNDFDLKNITKDEIKALSRSIYIDLNSNDFYENVWEKINNLLKKETNDIFWNLIEIYSNKEKNIIFMDNEIKTQNDAKIKFNDEIINNRKEFYYRLKKIIIGLEL